VGSILAFSTDKRFVNFNNEKEICAAVTPQTKYLWVETPTNPSLHVIDFSLVARVSKQLSIPFVVDSTFAPPCSTRPFEYGAETVIHSLSKYIAGHNDVLGGAVITKNPGLHERLVFMQKTLGAVLSPDECYRVLQGVKTLTLRWRWVSESALCVSRFLVTHRKVKRVLYPGLISHPGHVIAKRQSREGFGGVLSFELREHRLEKLKCFVDVLRKTSPIIYGESLASPETIISYPALMSHKSLPQEVRRSLGISDSFFRLSLGFEDPKDIIFGFTSALNAI